MTKGKHFKKMTMKEFDSLKAMLGADIPIGKVSRFTGRTWNTLDFVRKAATYGEYTALVSEHVRNHPKRSTEKSSPEQPVSSKNPQTDTRELVRALYQIDATLNRLVNAWEARPEKKGIFG